MQMRQRLVSALAILALAASLAVAPGLLQSATATTAPAAPERTTVTAQCAAAQSGVASAKVAKAKAKKALKKANRKLRAAKHSHRPAKIAKAKKVVKKAKRRFNLRSRHLNTQYKRMAYACSAPGSATRANATGQKVGLLVSATGALGDLITSLQLNALLDRLLPTVTGALSPAQLTSLLAGFNTQGLTLDDATALLGDSFSPTELQSILDGTAGPALVLELANHIIGQLSEMTGGAVSVPGSFDPTDLLETIAGVFGALDPTQLGGLVDLLLTVTGHSGQLLDAAQLTSLLDGLAPGVSGLLSLADQAAMLSAINGTSLDAATLSNLLGGQFSTADLTTLLGGGGTDALKGTALGNIVAQLGTLDGSALTLPSAGFDAAGLLTTITSLVGDVIASIPILGPVVCTLLPFLC